MNAAARLSRRVAMLAILAIGGSTSAMADCRADLVATEQNLQITRAGIEGAAKNPETQRCPAFRKHYGALIRVRDVLARCDTGTKKGERAIQLNASIDDFRKQMPRGCEISKQ